MQAFWNAKFQTHHFIYGDAPNTFVQENSDLLRQAKKVLCLGEGEGRNALFLAAKGLKVEALDASDVALFKLRKRAKEHHLLIKIRHTLLEYWQPDTHYDAVICTYLQLAKPDQKMLFEKSLEALAPNGYFIAEFFSESQRHFQSGGPKDLAFLYDVNAILAMLKEMPCNIIKLAQEVVLLSEGDQHSGPASVIRMILQKNQ